MKNEIAGDPMTGLKWTRRTTQKIADELQALGIRVCPKTVGRLLKQMGFSLRVNHKKLARSGPDRDEQFAYIAEMRESFAQQGLPIVSVDTKKKELVGNFKNGGANWQRVPVLVNDHDFRSDAKGIAIPYGIYDVQANRGFVFVGMSYETSEFAVQSLAKWWIYDGRRRYPEARKILILADVGGCNGSQRRAWKYELQNRLCDRFGIAVTVCHYPTAASKWNPIEHRLFSEISKNWAGRPLDSYEVILNYIRTTTTSKGLRVKAYLDKTFYTKGLKISDREMKTLNLAKRQIQPKRNYTLSPR